MCPEDAILSRPESCLYLDDFEDACNLAKGCKPGPKSKEWIMRWRGKDSDTLVGGETRAQGQFVFKDDPTTSSPAFRGVKAVFAMIHKGKHLLFECHKTANLQRPAFGSHLEEDWNGLFDPIWEIDTESDLESDSSIPKKPKSPPIGGLIHAKNKPGPNPGSIVQPSKPYIEARPDWAWDVTGRWEVTEGHLARQGEDSFKLSLFLANNPRNTKIGRQLWAEYTLGSKYIFGSVAGYIRFCPVRPPLKEQHRSLASFEEACVLKEGVWAGPSPRGQ
jgi:hypothetical protein